jgi:hypothetical protein
MDSKTNRNPDSMATSQTPGHISTHYYGSLEVAQAQALAMTRQGYRSVTVADTLGVQELRWFVVAVR